MMFPARRALRPVAAAIFMALLAACAARDPRPALVAKSEAGSYGYSDSKLSDGRYEVFYETPSFSVPVAGSERQSVLERERQRAFDFALWHAAELAKANGFEGVSVEQDRRDVDVSVRTEPSHLWPGFYRPYYPYHYRYRPWLLYDDDCCWPGHVHYQRWASARVTVALTVELLEAPAEGEEVFDVDDTLARLSSRYGKPTYP